MDKHLDPGMAGDYAEGILDPAARAIADAHLQGCADCRREVAAASAYFRDISLLEPIQAPADFLAKVRARLPGEAPWRRALSAVLRPLRVVPVQLALATLIGITAVTVYVQQGGLESESVNVSEDARPTSAAPLSPALEAAPTQPALADNTPASPEPVSKLLEKETALPDAPKPAPRAPAKDLAAQYAKAAEESDKLIGPAGSGVATKSRPISDAHPLKGTADGPLAGIAAVDADRAPAREKKSAQPGGKGAIGTRRDAPSPVAIAEENEVVESLDMPMSESAPAPTSAPAQVGRAREILANAESESRPAKVTSAPKAKAERAPAQPEAAAANQYSEELESSDDGYAMSSKENARARSESRAAAKAKADAGTYQRAAPAEPASASAVRQEDGRAVFTLKLRALKDTAALFSGLRSMGIRVEAAASPGVTPGIRRRLESPASMMPDLKAYLSRYGTLTGTVADPARIELLLIAP